MVCCGCCLSKCCCPQLYELRQFRRQLATEEKAQKKIEAQNDFLNKTHLKLQDQLEKLSKEHQQQSKELKSQLAQARVTLHEVQTKHKILEASPSQDDIAKEKKKVSSEHFHRFKELEKQGEAEVETERRKGAELRRGHETVAALEVKISQMLQTCQGLESQAGVHHTNRATAVARIQEVDAANRNLAMENQALALRLQEMEAGGQRYDALAFQHDDYQTKVTQLREQMQQSEQLSIQILRQEEVHARLISETNVLEARVLQAANVAAERGEKVRVLGTDLEALKLRQQELQATQLPQHAQLTNMLLTSEVSEKEAEAEMIRTQEELARLRQEAAMLQPRGSLVIPTDAEISALLGELDASKSAMRKNEVRLEKMRQRQERQAHMPEPKPRLSAPKAKTSSPSKLRGAPPPSAVSQAKATVEALVVEKFVADSLDPNSLSLETGERVAVVASSGAWATVRRANGQTGVAPIVCLQMEEAPVSMPPARDIRPKMPSARTGKSPGAPKAAAKPKVNSSAVRASAAERQQRLSGGGGGVRQAPGITPGQSLRARAAGSGYAQAPPRSGGRSALDKPILQGRATPRTQEAQVPVPVATVGIDTTGDGNANYYVTGPDLTNDGIPDALETQGATSLPVYSPVPSAGASPAISPQTTAFPYPT